MDFILRTPLPGFTVETTVADGTGSMQLYDRERGSPFAWAVLPGDPVTRHFAASAALAADPRRIVEPLHTLSAVPAAFAVESPTPTGRLRTQVSPHGSVTLMEFDGAPDPQWISARGPAGSAPAEHATVWREVSRVAADQAGKAPAVAEAASTRSAGLPASLPPPVDNPARLPASVHAVLGLDARHWQCGTPDGVRWLLWATTPTGHVETPSAGGRPRVWPSEAALRHEAAQRGQMVQQEPQALPPALAEQVQVSRPADPERSAAHAG